MEYAYALIFGFLPIDMRKFIPTLLLAFLGVASAVNVSKLLADEWHLFKVQPTKFLYFQNQ